jgi:pSer/pThr/pTyr-binding forkhead associated (FHA) protein
MSDTLAELAKIVWENPENGQTQEFILTEDANVSIGRSPDNEICIPERTVSRHHAAIAYQHGVFVVTDTGSANGVFVNDEKVEEPYPLIDGDIVRLYVPTIQFFTVVGDDEPVAPNITVKPVLQVTAGPKQGTQIIVEKSTLTFGRETSNATWEITLPDKSISRPHARLFRQDGYWYMEDLNSANGTIVDGKLIEQPSLLRNGSLVMMGETAFIFELPEE